MKNILLNIATWIIAAAFFWSLFALPYSIIAPFFGGREFSWETTLFLLVVFVGTLAILLRSPRAKAWAKAMEDAGFPF